MTATLPHALAEIAEAVVAAFDRPSARQREILRRIERHAERLTADRFQLAVLGQFKRGEAVQDSIARTRDILASVRDRRRTEDVSVRDDVMRLERLSERLEELEHGLDGHDPDTA